LLSEGEVSGLADHQVSPLDTNNRYEISRLSEFKGFSGVANWALGDKSYFVELWKAIISRVKSA